MTMKTTRSIVTSAGVLLVALFATAVWSALAGSGLDYEKSIKWGEELAWSAAGVWVISVPTPAGNMLMLHTNHAQDLSGTRYGGVMWEVNGNPTYFGAFPDSEQGNYWATQTIRTGPDTYETAMLTYATKKREGTRMNWWSSVWPTPPGRSQVRTRRRGRRQWPPIWPVKMPTVTGFPMRARSLSPACPSLSKATVCG